MSKQISNPYAFPAPNSAHMNNQEGMSMRDYFAGQVLGAVFHGVFEDWRTGKAAIQEDWPTGIAIDAYRVADAMLKIRQPPNK